MTVALDMPLTKQLAVSADGTSISYGLLGAGRPLLLLHGLQRTQEVWCDVVPALGYGRQIVLPDLRGRGQSGCPVEVSAYRLIDLADDLEAVIHQVEGSLDIIAWSLGSAVAMALAHRPIAARVRRWVLLSSLLDRQDAEHLFPGPDLDDVQRQAAERVQSRQMSESAAPSAVAAIWWGLRNLDPLVVPTAHPMSMLLVHGDQDPECRIDAARDFASRQPGASLVVLPGVGHNPMRDYPVGLCRILLDFLEAE